MSYRDFDSKTGGPIPDQVSGSTHDGTSINTGNVTTGGLGLGGGEALVLSIWHQLVVTFNPTGDEFKVYGSSVQRLA